MDSPELVLRRVVAERAKLLAFIRSIVRSPDVTEDVYQDLCILVIQKRPEVRSDAHLSGWLRTAARQLAMNALRKRSRHGLTLGDRIHELMEPHWSELDAVSGSAAADALEFCLSRLGPRARDLLRRRYTDGLRFEEIARELGRPVASLYVTLSRIHKRLAECILRRLSLAEH